MRQPYRNVWRQSSQIAPMIVDLRWAISLEKVVRIFEGHIHFIKRSQLPL